MAETRTNVAKLCCEKGDDLRPVGENLVKYLFSGKLLRPMET